MDKTHEEVMFTIGKTKHYKDGIFEYSLGDGFDENQGSCYEYYDTISVQFNQLKAKLFNLVEASMTDGKQRDAMKGLIKGFCNNHYNNLIEDMDNWMERMGFKIECIPHGAEPLEHK